MTGFTSCVCNSSASVAHFLYLFSQFSVQIFLFFFNFQRPTSYRQSKNRRKWLFQNKEKSVDNNAVPLVLNFHPALSGVSQKVKSSRPVLHPSDKMKEVFKDTKPLILFRRPRNLADNLVRSKIKMGN